MTLLRIVMLTVVCVAIVAVISEVLVPLFRGTQFFPHLRKSPAREKISVVQAELEEAEEELTLKELQDELRARRALAAREESGTPAGVKNEPDAPGQPAKAE